MRATRKARYGRKHRPFRNLFITLLSTLVVVAQFSNFSIGRAQADEAAGHPFFDSVLVTDHNNQEVDLAKTDSNPLTTGDTVHLEYSWSQKEGATLSPDEEITVQVPKELKIDKEISGDVTSGDQVIGTYKVVASDNTTDANKFTIHFNDQAKNLTNATGKINFDGTFAAQIDKNTTKHELPFDLGENQVQKLEVPVKAASTDNAASSEQDENSASADDGQKQSDAASEPAKEETKAPDSSNEQAKQDDGSSVESSKPEAKADETGKSSEQKIERGFSSLATTQAPKKITQNILTGVTLTDKDGKPFDEDNPANTDDPANINFTWSIPDDLGATISAGDTYEFDLPSIFKMHNDINGTLDDYGTFTVDTNGHVVMTFNDQVKENSNVHGTLFVNTEFDEKEITGPVDQTITFPVNSDSPIVTVHFKPDVEKTIEKKGSFDRGQNPSKVTWTVDVNKELAGVTDAKVTENWPSGINFNSVKVYKLDVDVQGNVTQGDELTSGYSVDSNGNVTFDGTIQSAYRLVYQTTIDNSVKPDDGGTVNFDNVATFSGKDFPGIDAEASVTANYGKTVEKSKTSYDGDSQTFGWQINYNFGEKEIAQKDATITDNFNSTDLQLVDGLNVQKVDSFDGTTPKLGDTLKEGTDYTLEKTSTGFTIHFNDKVTSAYVITYQTKVKDGVVIDNPTNFKNDVTTGTGSSGGSGGQATQQNITKGYSNINYAAKTVNWNLTINKNKYEMNDWKLDDTFTSGGLSYVSDSLKILDTDKNNYQLVKDKDYTLTLKPDNQGFNIAFIGDYAKTSSKFTISYTTHFNVDFSNQKNVKNSATATWTDQYGKGHTNDASAAFNANNQTQFNGFKNGSYNAVDKVITWKVGVNYNGEKANNASITDPITGNQKFVSGSVVVKSYTINSGGSIKEGADLDPSKYEITEPSADNETLTVKFKTDADDTNQYMVEFKTSLDGQVVNGASSYTNIATYHNDGHPDRQITGTVSITNGGTLATKNGTQSGNYVNWFVNVNPSQSALDDVTVTDDPSDNQILDENSFHVYEAKYDGGGAISENGNLVPNTDKELQRDKDYTVTITTDNATGKQQFVLKFIGAYKHIDRAFAVQYRSVINIAGSSDDVTNKVNISGDNVQTVTQDTTQKITVAISTGGGSATGQKGTLRILKNDTLGQILPGATFELWSQDNKQLLRTGTTADDGTLTFGNIRYGDYVLKEVQAPSGYTISDALVAGISVKINANSTTDGVYTTIVDQQNKVTLLKKDADGNVLPGATFKLEQSIGGVYVPYNYGSDIKSGSDGKVVLTGLPIGSYRLTETSAPSGYLINTKSIEFTVVKNVNNQVPDVDAGTLTDYQGSAKLIKTDSNGHGLKDAVFSIIDKDGKTVQEDLTSDKDGIVQSKETLAPGTYFFVETKAPEGYLINTKKIKFTITGSALEKPTVVTAGEAINYAGSAELKKVDKDGKGLEGAEFKIVDADGKTVQENLKSDENGKVTAENLKPGKYSFVETKAPEGYLINSDKIAFTIADDASGKPVTVKAPDAVNYQGTVELTKTDSDGHGLEGAEFKIIDADGKTVQEHLESNKNGKVTAVNLKPGKYSFVETKAPEGYVLNTDKIDFEITGQASGEPKTIVASDAVNYKGSVVLTKVDADGNGLKDAVFKIVDANGKAVQENLTSDENGKVTAEDLKPGQYSFVETKAPDGYLLNTNTIDFTIENEAAGAPVMVKAPNAVNYQGTVELIKTDADGHGLEGAVFKIVDASGKAIQENLESDKDGKIKAENLKPGKYTFVETKAPDGYLLNTDKINFTIKDEAAGVPVVVKAPNAVNYQGTVELTKTDAAGNGLEGAEFKIIDANGKVVQDNLKSDKNGKVTAENLEPGKYSFVETKAPEGYLINSDNIEFTISDQAEGVPTVVKAADAVNYQGSVELTKVDSDGNGLEGAEFKIVDADGKTVQENLKSDENGKVTAENLKPGKYSFVETKAPEGYLINSDNIKFTISDQAEGVPTVVKAADAVNYQGTVELQKTDSDGNGLEGAVFNLLDKDGKVVREGLTSNADGLIKADGLAPGEYQFVETKAPNGYLLNASPKAFTIQADSSGEPATVKLTKTNDVNSVILTKVDKNDQDAVLKGAEFKLVNSNGDVVTKDASGNKLKDIWTTNENGQFTVNNLPEGDYQFIETKAPANYDLDTTPLPFKVTRTDHKAIEITATNKLTPGDVKLTKVDANDKDAVLQGAEFKLQDSKGNPVAKDSNGKDLPAIWTTDEHGEFTVKGLAPGDYQFIEVKAPQGYQLDGTPIPFSIAKGQEKPVEITALNKAIPVIDRGVDAEQQSGGSPKSEPTAKPQTGAKIERGQLGLEETSAPKNKKNLPTTGDTNDLLTMLIGIMLLLGGGSIAALSRRKKD